MNKPVIPKQTINTSFGRIAYLSAGAVNKPPVLFVHGIPTSSFLWRHVLRFLQDDFRCYAPDLMGLGDTDVDPDRNIFHMAAQAEMLVEFMEVLGHPEFALVCHDQGGAAAQLIAARMPERVSCFIITNCVCYDNWPVPEIVRLQKLARLPLLMDMAVRTGLIQWMQSTTLLSTFKKGVLKPERLTVEAIQEYLRPLSEGERQRRRFMNFLLAGNPRYSLQAVEGLRQFQRPTMVIWALDDRFLSPSWGRKLFEDIPGAQRLEQVPFCGHFWQEERPAEFSSRIHEFLMEHAPIAASSDTET